MDLLFLTVDEILELHGDQVLAFGGDPGVRDMGLLQSAVAMPQAGFGEEFAHVFPDEMAAAYLFHIAANHPFVDGNKRTALAAALTFLEMNGFRIEAGRAATGDLVLDLAAGKIDKAAVTAFFKIHTRPA
jgi:death-on-curing protein